MPDSSVMAVVVLVVVIVGLALIIRPYFRQKRERMEQLQVIAAQRGWTFVRAATVDTIPGCESFELFISRHSRTIENMMSGEADGIKTAVFDYSYVSDHGEEGSGGETQTVLYLESSKLNVPHFSLQPENVLHKLFPNLGFKDIDFGQRPAFSNQYLLSGDDEGTIRNTFNDWLLAFYETHPGICTEGRGNQLFIYRDNQTLEPSEIQSLIDLGLNILSLLTRQL
jgi:hypothetical protein